jgi:hypothetical protein
MTQTPPPTRNMVGAEMGDIIANVTEHANEMNRRWGFNRLPYIVSIDLMQRFKSQKRKWAEACFDCAGSCLPADIERLRKHGEAMKRAYAALEAEALAQGKVPAPPGQWEFELKDGTPIVLCRTRAEMGNVQREPQAQVWCLEEIGEIITRFPELLTAKNLFPAAEIIRLAPDQRERELVDEILSDIPFD